MSEPTTTRTAPGRSTVEGTLTPTRSRRAVENDEYARFAHRVLDAHGRRIARGDVEGLADLADAVQVATRTAVTGLRGEGYSWTEIADRLGVTRQAAQQRFGGAA